MFSVTFSTVGRRVFGLLGLALAAAAGSACLGHGAAAQESEPELTPGRGAFLNSPRDAAENRPDRLSQGPLTVRYLDAEVVAVIDDIVGEVLGLDYTIAADVQGRISLRMTEVTSREAVLQQLQAALAAINVAMIDRGDFIAFVRGGASGGSGGVAVIQPGEPVAPGVGVAAIQLREATPTVITPLLTALVSDVQVRLAASDRVNPHRAAEPARGVLQQRRPAGSRGGLGAALAICAQPAR